MFIRCFKALGVVVLVVLAFWLGYGITRGLLRLLSCIPWPDRFALILGLSFIVGSFKIARSIRNKE